MYYKNGNHILKPRKRVEPKMHRQRQSTNAGASSHLTGSSSRLSSLNGARRRQRVSKGPLMSNYLGRHSGTDPLGLGHSRPNQTLVNNPAFIIRRSKAPSRASSRRSQNHNPDQSGRLPNKRGKAFRARLLGKISKRASCARRADLASKPGRETRHRRISKSFLQNQETSKSRAHRGNRRKWHRSVVDSRQMSGPMRLAAKTRKRCPFSPRGSALRRYSVCRRNVGSVCRAVFDGFVVKVDSAASVLGHLRQVGKGSFSVVYDITLHHRYKHHVAKRLPLWGVASKSLLRQFTVVGRLTPDRSVHSQEFLRQVHPQAGADLLGRLRVLSDHAQGGAVQLGAVPQNFRAVPVGGWACTG